jgi:hypothetical protein
LIAHAARVSDWASDGSAGRRGGGDSLLLELPPARGPLGHVGLMEPRAPTVPVVQGGGGLPLQSPPHCGRRSFSSVLTSALQDRVDRSACR